MRKKAPTPCFVAALCLGWVGAAVADEDEPTAWRHRPNRDAVRALIVKVRDDATAQALVEGSRNLARLSNRAGMSLRHQRAMAGNAHLLRLPRWMNREEATALAQRLAQEPEIEFVTPDRVFHVQTFPNDPDYTSYSGNSDAQWHLLPPTSEPAGADLPPAWSVTTGDPSLVIAVLDTGLVPHQDIGAAIPTTCGASPIGRILPGCNMISDPYSAGQTGSETGAINGRSCNPTDLGDWDAAKGCSLDDPGNPTSSWHGTHVTGIAAATGNNGIFVAGVNWQSKILPVRVLGKCGGNLSDIYDAIYWAAGLPLGDNSGIPMNSIATNQYPAKVINMSLGVQTVDGSGNPIAQCDAAMQSAIDAATQKGAIIVVAASNYDDDAKYYEPANCNNVITVAAVARNGGLGYAYGQVYSDYGYPTVTVSAPGGDAVSGTDFSPDGILSTMNSGTTTPVAGGDIVSYDVGTSMATPIVTGIVSLILSVNPNIDANVTYNSSVGAYSNVFAAAMIVAYTARSFPTVSSQYQCSANTSATTRPYYCGFGMVDAGVAVAAALPPVANAGQNQSVAAGAMVTLSGSASAHYTTGFLYQWTKTAGPSVTLSNSTSATPTFKAPSSPATLTFQLTVTDSVQLTGTSTVTIYVGGSSNQPPSANAGQNQTVQTGATVFLQGTATTHPSGLAVTYAWSQTDGVSVTLSSATAQNPTFTAPPTTTNVVLSLVVTDSNQLSSSPSTLTISVQQPGAGGSQPPVAVIRADAVADAGSTVTLSGATSYCSSGSISSYLWSQVTSSGASAVTLDSANQAVATFTAPSTDAGVNLEFVLTVTDNMNLTGTASTTVVINPANSAPPPPQGCSCQDTKMPGLLLVFLCGLVFVRLRARRGPGSAQC